MKSTGQKILFIVQGEGRGHMTQAITAYDILTSNAFNVCAVMIGCSSNREVPEFFYKQISAPIVKFKSPNFITDKKNKSIKVLHSIISNFALLSVFRQSMKLIKYQIRKHQPDLILNFYDPLIGICIYL